jgi:hypothetical protein
MVFRSVMLTTPHPLVYTSDIGLPSLINHIYPPPKVNITTTRPDEQKVNELFECFRYHYAAWRHQGFVALRQRRVTFFFL